jgi:hypothetical protein
LCNNVVSLKYIGKYKEYGFDEAIIDKEKVISAINCGGNAFKDGNGIRFSEDKYFGHNDGKTFGIGGGYYSISDGKKDKSQMYNSCRAKNDNFWYSIPVPNGEFVISLAFEEFLDSSSTKRSFDVLINDEPVLIDFNPYSVLNGMSKSGIYHFPVTITKHLVRIEFDGSNPIVNGIIIRGKKQQYQISKTSFSSKYDFLTEDQIKQAFFFADSKQFFCWLPTSEREKCMYMEI